MFVFGAAFPFFNNVDEQAHVDVVYKYARGHVPSSTETFDREAIVSILLYSSPEYHDPAGHFTRQTMPEPVWRRIENDPNRDAILDTYAQKLSKNVNLESLQPPLYYAVAGAWLWTGKALGLRGGNALYWIRFLNGPLIALLTWLAYVFARTFFPEDGFLKLGIPVLVAFFPTDTFYSVNNDILLPILGGAAAICLLRIARGDANGYRFHVFAGLLVAGCLMVKLSSLAIVPVAVAAVALAFRRARSHGSGAILWAKAASLGLGAAVPVAVWGARNVMLAGDVTASAAKLTRLHWTLKPFASLWGHPIFSWAGLAGFWQETMARFWRGEFVWRLEPMAPRGLDAFYGASSAVLLLAVIGALAARRRALPRGEQVVAWLSVTFFLLSLLFLAAVSVAFDFDGCDYPSSARPFLTSGRLALAALIPFVALYLGGLGVLLPGRRGVPARWTILLGLIVVMTISEIAFSRSAFDSAFNWLHMR